MLVREMLNRFSISWNCRINNMMGSVYNKLRLGYLRLLHPRYRIEFLEEEAPEDPEQETFYIVMWAGEPWHVSMLCPCGCGEMLHMNLIPDGVPVWHLSIHQDSSISLYPSVLRNRGCHSHFWIRNDRIFWCGNSIVLIWRRFKHRFA